MTFPFSCSTPQRMFFFFFPLKNTECQSITLSKYYPKTLQTLGWQTGEEFLDLINISETHVSKIRIIDVVMIFITHCHRTLPDTPLSVIPIS